MLGQYKTDFFISSKYTLEKTEGKNQEWTIRMHWLHWAHKTQEVTNKTKNHNTEH